MPKGKAGNHLPLDVEEDFENPTTAPGSVAEEQLGQAQEAQEETPEPQLELEGTAATAETPKVIRNGKMLVEFVRPHFHKEKDGDRYVGFEFSFPLTKEHEVNGHLPSEVLAEWDHMKNGNSTATVTRFGVTAPQTISVGLVPDDPEHDLILVAASLEQSSLAYVQESGSGKRQQVIRFAFRAVVDQTETAAKFAVDHHGDSMWISMQRTQGSLIE